MVLSNSNSSNISYPGQRGGNIFLIGFMGSGKSHWGKIWASINQMSFIDLDDLIEKREGKTISAIFESSGEDHFRKSEAAALSTCADFENTIIATGGGTPCFFENMQWMNSHGITIYISSTAVEIAQRLLPEMDKRPLLKNLTQVELLNFIEKKLKERERFYSQAQLTVQSGHLNEDAFPVILSTITT